MPNPGLRAFLYTVAGHLAALSCGSIVPDLVRRKTSGQQ